MTFNPNQIYTHAEPIEDPTKTKNAGRLYMVTAGIATVAPAILSALTSQNGWDWANVVYIILGLIVAAGPATAAKRLNTQVKTGVFDKNPTSQTADGLAIVQRGMAELQNQYSEMVNSVTQGIDQVARQAGAILPGPSATLPDAVNDLIGKFSK